MRLDNKTNEELLRIQKALQGDPANRATDGGIFLYTPATHKKLDRIAEAITHNIVMQRKAEGTYVPVAGYSGRKSKRRR